MSTTPATHSDALQHFWHDRLETSDPEVFAAIRSELGRQRNKIELILSRVHLIHSVDSLRLLTALEREAVRRQRALDVLLEVNASRESNKDGFTPGHFADEVRRALGGRAVC